MFGSKRPTEQGRHGSQRPQDVSLGDGQAEGLQALVRRIRATPFAARSSVALRPSPPRAQSSTV